MPTQSPPADQSILFLLRLGRALHEADHSTPQIEAILEETSLRLGLTGQFFATPTSIFAAFGSEAEQRTFMIRTVPKSTDLGRLVRVTDVARGVLIGALSPAAGTDELARIEHRKPLAPATAIVAYALASAAAARFLGGGLAEIEVAAGAGLLTGSLAVVAERVAQVGRIFPFLAAFLCSFGVAWLGALVPGFSASIATLAGLIVLIPGLTLTTAIAELATSHLAAGTARLASAFITFIGIGFGVALGSRVAGALVGAAASGGSAGLPDWTLWIALGGAALAFALLLRADGRDWPWIAGAGVVAFIATRIGGRALGPELGVFVGALALSIGANWFNRITLRPSAVPLVPGLLTLVPGSIGFRSLTSLLENQVVAGIDTAFTMLLTAISLVAGLLTAAAVFPERRISG